MPRKRDGITILDVWKTKGRHEGKRWLARVRDTRKHAYRNKAFETLDGAEKWADEEKAKMQLGLSSAGHLMLEKVTAEHLLEMERKGRSEKHRDEVGAILATAVDAGVRDLKDDDLKAAVRRWLAKAKADGLSERSRNKRLVILHGAVRFALGEGWLSVDPMIGMKGETERATTKVREVFSADELRAMVADANRRDPLWPLAVSMIYLGLRIGEAHALRWSWFDWQGRGVTVKQEDDFSPKRHQERRIPLMAEAIEMLGPLKQDEGFVAARAAMVTPGGRSRQFASYLKRIGIKADGRGAHCVRHTWVSLRLALGVPSLVVKRQAGHTTILTTERYEHAIPAGWIDGWPLGGDGEFRLLKVPAAAIVPTSAPAVVQ